MKTWIILMKPKKKTFYKIWELFCHQVSGNGAHVYKGVGVRFADLSNLSQISHENEIIWSHIFIGYLKTRGRKGGSRDPLNPSGPVTGYK